MLGQAQVKLEVLFEVGVKFGVELEPCHYLPGGWVDLAKINANIDLVDVVVELG